MSDMKGKIAMLASAEKFSGAAQFQIMLGDFEAVRSRDHSFDALAGGAHDVFGRDEHTSGFFAPSANPTAKLVELSQAKAIGVFDKHHGCVRHVQADFDDGGRD